MRKSASQQVSEWAKDKIKFKNNDRVVRTLREQPTLRKPGEGWGTRVLGFVMMMVVFGTGIASAQTAAATRATSAATRATAADDPVLKAMQEELQRSQAKLQLPGQPKPFFIQYRVEDLASYDARADYGAVTQEHENHQRAVRVEVHVGDYTRDNSSGRGDGTVLLTTAENNIDALRFSLWTATDTAYKNALQQYSNKLAKLKGFEVPPAYDDFSHEKPEVSIGPTSVLEIDRAAWKKRIEHTSGLFLDDKILKDKAIGDFANQVEYSIATVNAMVLNRYIVNTEGSVVRDSRPVYRATIGIGTQAADGMHLDRSYGSVSVSAAKLDTAETMDSKTAELLVTLRELSKAPVVSEQYYGPVLFTGDASSDIVDQLFKPNVEADRPDLGTTARTQGEYTSSYKQRVLPSFLSVVDDPTLKEWKGEPLIGAYEVDDEAVPGQKVDVVTRGLLQNYLICREPVRDFPESNGHGRAPIAGAARSLAGVLVVKSSSPLTAEQMYQSLISEAKDAGQSIYYVAETLGPQLSPRLLWRVNVADGKSELVRGAVFDELDQRSLRTEITAAGAEPFVDNVMDNEHGEIPVTILSPALLFKEIGVKRATDEQEKLPYYPPPPVMISIQTGDTLSRK